MQSLANVSGLGIRQAKEWGEILTGVETKNKYQVVDQDGASLFYAAEVGGSWITRIFLKSFRPFTVKVVENELYPIAASSALQPGANRYSVPCSRGSSGVNTNTRGSRVVIVIEISTAPAVRTGAGESQSAVPPCS